MDVSSALAVGNAAGLAEAARLDAALGTTGGEDPRAVATRFEAVLATQFVKEMRRSLESGFFGTEAGGDIYGGWLDQHLGEALATSGALGLEDALVTSLALKQRAQDGVGA